jgi:hypothetical protein
MTRSRLFQITGICAVVATITIAVSNTPSHANAESGDSRIQIGLNAAPVPLDTRGKNMALVGLGSYYVNVVGDCDGCHSAGPATEFARGGNPYFNQPEQVNLPWRRHRLRPHDSRLSAHHLA